MIHSTWYWVNGYERYQGTGRGRWLERQGHGKTIISRNYKSYMVSLICIQQN